ncbi:SET domain-containing protein [Ekhidna sp.]|uniref:SET domain-containing protein n=1 Tax=Ekhidna sp. TaxID=2608089 RepID=UPI003B599018
MIHPKTEIKHISDEVGYGVFATELIPEGTIVYVKDSLEIVVSPTDYLLYSGEMQEVIEKYSYIDETGNRIISWDFAKYVNHCCNCNTISTGYGFELAIRDIQPGEQITDEYGIFNLETEIPLICGQKNCRKKVGPTDFEDYYETWDIKIKQSISHLFEVEQPLMPLIDMKTRGELDQFFQDPAKYKSVYALKYKKTLKNHPPQLANGLGHQSIKS